MQQNSTFIAVALFTILCAACSSDDEPSTPAGPDTKTAPDTSSNENRAPELFKIGDKIVEAGTKLVIRPQATDADNDDLTWSILGDVPDDAIVTKNPPRFEWTPTTAPAELFTTFVVSDGLATDRETVQIRVVSESLNHPPVFQQVSDQAVEVEQALVLQLQATDPDGDTLKFSSANLPEGSTLDANNGSFRWTPAPSLAGTNSTVDFTVKDAVAESTISVLIRVLAPGQNKPPTFSPLAPQVAEVGKPYSLALSPNDPDGDSLNCGMDGTPPAGVAFDPPGCSLTWTPVEDQAGKTFTFVFWVSDATYKIYQDVDIQVNKPGQQTGACIDDVNEPNNTPEFATQVTVGTYEKLSICDTESTPVDTDWFAVSLSSGQTLSIKLAFEHDDGDVDLAVYKTSDINNHVAISDTATDDEQLSYAVPAAGTYLVRVYGTGQASFTTPYMMVISTAGLDCEDDMLEPNDTPTSATPLLIGDATGTLEYCPADLDWFSIDLTCGQTLGATIAANQALGNLDLYIYRASNTVTHVASSTEPVGSTETAFYEAVADETALVLVRGQPAESTQNTYSLTTQATGTASCGSDGLEPNDSKLGASQLTSPIAEIDDLELCCDEDWFFVPLSIGDGMLATIKFDAAKSVSAAVYRVDDDTPIALGVEDPEGLLLTVEAAQFSGNYYIRVEGSPGTSYGVEMIVLENAGCLTSKGCSADQVCIKTTGQCVSNFCSSDIGGSTECPSGQEMPCVAGQCLDGCTYDADCKLTQACKGFEFGKYCGPKGGQQLGEACSNMTECTGSASCAFQASGGYCTLIGCVNNSDCSSLDGSCVQHLDLSVCGVACSTNDDCRKEAGFTCQPKSLPNGLPANVCLPTS